MSATTRTDSVQRLGAGVLLVAATAAALTGCTGHAVELVVTTPKPSFSTAADVFRGSSCPGTVTPPATGDPDANRLVVPFLPTRALICNYQQAQQNGVTEIVLAKTVHASGGDASGWATAFNTATVTWPKGDYACPADFGAHTDGYFQNGTGEAIEVEIDQTGCSHVSNGTLKDRELSGPLDMRLDSAFGAPRLG